MKYIPYGIAFAIVAGIVLAVPPRTARYSFPVVYQVRTPVLKIIMPSAVSPSQILPLPVKKALPSVAAPLPVSLSQPSPAPSAPKLVTNIPIHLQSVVVVKCLFKNALGNETTAYGSGVIVGTEGYVLTARHVVDMAYAYRITGGKQGLRDYSLDSCRIAVPPDSTKTPTMAEIRAMNPFTLVTEFAYNVQVAFVPPASAQSGMSDGEYDFADSALLRITSATNGSMPHAFVASPMKIFDVPATGDEVVSFGFPSGVPSYGNNFYLQGSVGVIKDVVGGDKLFKDQPMGMAVEMETIGGRSGSPVFWHGYVIGVVSAKEDYSRTTAIAGIFPIARFAGAAGIAVFK